MAFRRLLRGRVPWDRLEAVAAEVARRYEEPTVRVRFLEADNWLSTPCVVNDEYFVKIITPQHSLVHALLTTGRNLGAVSSGTPGFFEHFGDPVEMADHELSATRRMRGLGVNAPAPIEAFEHDGLGVLVLEYIAEFEPLDAVDAGRAAGLAPALFDALATMHRAGLAHGDLRAENVLVSDGDLYFIDATAVDGDAIAGARAYDVACGLAALEPLVGSRTAVDAALGAYDASTLLEARAFLDFVNIRPDHAFDAPGVKGEIEKAAT
ncbi:MAG: RIO1 family regulatory kinase/ATPase [Halobacteriaceae archaeon]